jgi:hypothetical protein
LAKFRLSLKYEGSASEETVEVDAASVSEARRKCEGMVEDNSLMMDRLGRLNVYVSKRLRSCELCPYDFRMELLGCEGILKNDV